MSIKINIDSLNDDMREKIYKELKIELENSKYNQFAPKKEIYPFNIVKSQSSGNCLTNTNSVLTVTPCDSIINQQWTGSTDPILCSYEQV